MTTPAPIAVAYLTSQYPMLSMSFVLREVLQLRRTGARVDVASINRADRLPQDLTADERMEADRAYHLKAHGLLGAMVAASWALGRSPSRFVSGLSLALRLSGIDLRGVARHIAYFVEALMVGRWMAERGHGHLHVHLGSQPATVGMLSKRIFGHGLSVTVHGPDEFFDVERQHLAAKVAHSDFVCCISHYARSQLMRVTPVEHWNRLLVARLGVDAAHFQRPPTEAGPTTGPFRIVCIGRLTPAKGQHRLLDAVARLVRSGRAVRASIVGGGVDRSSLERHAERLGLGAHVSFVGPVTQDSIRDHYLEADCFCLPSFAEGIPVVLMEAMAMELPCVTTWVAGIPELIQDGSNGFLVAPSDVEALADVLGRLVDDVSLRHRIGQRARRTILDDYDLERNVACLQQIFEDRLGRDATASERNG